MPKYARKTPAIIDQTPPKIAPISKDPLISKNVGKCGNNRANTIPPNQPNRYCPGPPMLKKPALLATAKPRAVKINEIIFLKVSPIE